jgi:hypothetical protein
VPGEQQGDQLVAQLLVGEPFRPRAVRVIRAGQDQPREDVAALRQVRRRAPFADLGVDELVEAVGVLDRPAPGPEPLEDRVAPAQQHGRPDVDRAGDAGSQRGEPRLVADPEDDAQDHLQGERVHPVEAAELLAGVPPRHLGARDLLDQAAVPPQRVSVERRHQQRAGPLVLGAVLEQEGVLTHDRPEDGVALARVEHLGIAGEDLLGLLGPREQHQRPPARDDPDGEHVAVPPPHAGHELVPEAQQGHALEPDRPPRTRRQPAGLEPGCPLPAERAHPVEPARGQGGGAGLAGGAAESGHGDSDPSPY